MTRKADLYTAAHGDGPAAPAVVLLPAIAGVNEYVRRVAGRLAGSGYAVQTVDYFADAGGPPDVSTPEKIARAVAGLSDVAVLQSVRGAFGSLQRRRDVDPARIALMGFCIGGAYAMLAACELDGIAVVVNYYGSVRYTTLSGNKPVSPIDRVPDLRAPMIAHYGTADRFVPEPDVDLLEQALNGAGKSHELFRYGGAPHAFDEDFRPAYRPVAAREAWSRTLTFMDWYTRNQQ